MRSDFQSDHVQRDSMKNTRKPKPLSAERIARLADNGRDVSRFFTNKGRMMGPIQRVNVDLASARLKNWIEPQRN